MAWTLQGSLKGPQGNPGSAGVPGADSTVPGPTGPAGARGSKWFTGSGAPNAATLAASGAVVGDFYIRTDTGEFYELA